MAIKMIFTCVVCYGKIQGLVSDKKECCVIIDVLKAVAFVLLISSPLIWVAVMSFIDKKRVG
tara:strand:+ start:219 stop:404 length:186 start_codon:yes stop_codon:yes gene_type:complete